MGSLTPCLYTPTRCVHKIKKEEIEKHNIFELIVQL